MSILGQILGTDNINITHDNADPVDSSGWINQMINGLGDIIGGEGFNANGKQVDGGVQGIVNNDAQQHGVDTSNAPAQGGGDSNDAFSRAFNEILNIITNYYSYGVAGYKDGKFGAGVVTQPLADMANISQQQYEDAKSAILAQQLANAQIAVEEQKRKDQLDLQASRAAGLSRDSAIGSSKRSVIYNVSGSNSTYNPSRDFLGL